MLSLHWRKTSSGFYFWSFAAVLVVLWAMAAGAQAQECQFSGRVYNFSSPSITSGAWTKGSFIERHGAQFELVPFATLCVGDKVHVAEGVTVVVQQGEQEFLSLKGRAEFLLEQPAASQAKYDLSELSRFFLSQIKPHKLGNSRKGGLQITYPCLNEVSQCSKVEAFSRSLGFMWRGSARPFQVELSDCGFDILLSSEVVENQFETSVVNLQANQDYCINITDARGNQRRAKFSAHVAEVVPQLPEYGNDPWLTNEQKAILMAYGLISHGAEWAFEAYQYLNPYIDTYAPAKILAENLAFGRLPGQLQGL